MQIVAAPSMNYDHGRKNLPYKAGLSLGIVLLTPESKGSVYIQSSNPYTPPIIDPNIFSDEQNSDFIRMQEGFKLLLKVRQSENLKEYTNGNAILEDIEN